MSSSGFFEFRARREESADLARNRDSRRSRTPLAAESMNAKNANIEGSALLPETRWCKKKIVAISFEEGVVFRSRVLARTLLYVFLVTSTFFCWFFSNYVEDYLEFPKTLKLMHKSPTNVLPSVPSYQIRF